MWNLLKNKKQCERLRDLVEGSISARPELASIEELTRDLPTAERAHLADCANCLEAANDLLTSRRLFVGVTSTAGIDRPWFAARVMAAIAARERELSETARTWLAVPRFAARLALASAAVLLVVSTWLYERPLPVPNLQATARAAQESIFEGVASLNQEDVLAQENNR